VHDGDDQYVVVFNGVQDGVGENTNETAAHIIFENPPALWGCNDSLDGCSNLPGEAFTKIAASLFVKTLRLRRTPIPLPDGTGASLGEQAFDAAIDFGGGNGLYLA
jgi:hypothetical protein